MRLLVVGAGAVGSWLGGSAAAGGADVTFAEPGTRSADLERDGVTLILGDRVTRVRPRVVRSVSEARDGGPFDLVLVAVKSYHTEAVAAELRELPLRARNRVASFQNGIGNDGVLAAALPGALLITATLTTGLRIEATGAVHGSNKGGVGLPDDPSASDLAVALAAGGLAVRRYRDAAAMKWSKLILNLVGSATCAVMDRPPAEVFVDRRVFDVERAAFAEAVTVLGALGLAPVDLPGYPVRLLVHAMTRLPGPLAHRVLRGRLAGARGDRLPSVAADLALGRTRTENDVLTGAVVRNGEALGVPVPINRALYETVEALTAGQQPRERYAGSAEALLAAIDGVSRGITSERGSGS